MKIVTEKSSLYIQLVNIILLVYCLLVSISLLSTAFKCFGSEFAYNLITMTNNPFIGLLFGILVTSIIHSSSTTTSITVGMVASGVLTVQNAVPIVMGANIGTTVTNITVSIGHITRKEEFKRAFAGALMHDIFNVISVLILLPFELSTHILQKTASYFAHMTFGHEAFVMINPIKPLTNPITNLMRSFFIDILQWSPLVTGFTLLVLALLILFSSLFFISRHARAIMHNRTEILLDKAIARAGWIGILLGLVITAIIQSSAITTSTLVPLIGAGILSLESAFPITLGANVGTTVTALMASLPGILRQSPSHLFTFFLMSSAY
ncbi:MAG: Na/Pi symporter [bacterium]